MAGDPRSDPRAHDLLSADPGVVSSLAAAFRTVAEQAQSTAGGLRGAAGDADWTGGAAAAFRQGLGKLPGDLDKVTSSYQEAADALNAYEGELATLKPAFQSLVSQLGSADAQLASAQASLNGAQTALGAAQAKLTGPTLANPLAPLRTLPTSSPLITAVDAAGSAVGSAQGEIATLSARGFHILDEFDAARGTARGRIGSASQIPPHRSFWDSFFHDVGSVMGGALHFVEGIGAGIWNSVTGTLGALQNFVNNPSLDSFGKLAADVAVDASIVVLASAAPEALGLLGAEAAAEGGAEVATEEGTSLLARLAAAGKPADTVVTAGLGAHGAADLLQGHYANAAIDGAFMLIPSGAKVANWAGTGEAQVAETAYKSEALQTYSFWIDHGLRPAEALSLMSDGEVGVVSHSLNDFFDGSEMSAATDSARLSAAQAARSAARVGAPLAFGVDSAQDHGREVAQEAAGRMLHPEPVAACP